jgi:hypothetical protein
MALASTKEQVLHWLFCPMIGNLVTPIITKRRDHEFDKGGRKPMIVRRQMRLTEITNILNSYPEKY